MRGKRRRDTHPSMYTFVLFLSSSCAILALKLRGDGLSGAEPREDAEEGVGRVGE